MRRIIRNIYILAFITIIIFITVWYYQHHITNRHMLESARQTSTLSAQNVSEDISSWLAKNARTVEAAADYIALQEWSDDEILSYLKVLLDNCDEFSSIYFGSPHNRMIDATGWEPPPDFDLQNRPWYTEAVTQGQTVFTEAFFNARQNEIIITIAAPIYEADGNLMGVVGGDIPVSKLGKLINSQGIEREGFSFLVDGKGNIIAHPNYNYSPNAEFVNIQEMYGNLETIQVNHSSGLARLKLNGEEGYLAYLPVEDTNWYLASFIPLSVFAEGASQVSTEFAFAGAATALVFLLFVLYNYRYVDKPLLTFEENIRQIDLENSLSYRLPIEKHDEFAELGKTINRQLDKMENYFEKLEENERSLKETNMELEAILKQLTTAEEALDYSEEKLYFLSYHDQLTGLYNRAYFEAKLRQLNSKPEYPTTIISADIDGLKLINDTIGHDTGDRLLKACANIIQEALSTSGIPARIGGDEFAVILPLASKEEGECIARQIRYQVFLYNQEHPSLPLSLSLGVATAEDSSTTFTELFKQSDDLMHRDKLRRSTSARNGIVQSLMAALTERGYFTQGHARRLEKMCLKVGEKVGLASHQLADLALLAKVHDLGKVGISDQILFKPEPLSKEEWAIMKQHPEKGYRIASTSPDLAGVADLILKHHENWDGSGYPLGLKGEDIPIECRILAIVDAYDTMVHERPYRQAVIKGKAIAELRKCAGNQFDPHLVEVFATVLNRETG